MIYETERLIIRKWQQSDLDDLYEYGIQTDVGINAGWKQHETKEETQEILNKFVSGTEEFAIVYKENNKVIGGVGLHDNKKRAGNYREIGYVMNHDYWGKGIMTEAVRGMVKHGFNVLQLDYITVAHFDFNDRSRRVIEKCGFICEGTIHFDSMRFDGAYMNTCYYYMDKYRYKALYK